MGCISSLRAIFCCH